MKISYIACFVLLFAAKVLNAGVFAGVIRVLDGLIILDKAGMTMPPRRVVGSARVELGDMVRTAEESSAELMLSDGGVVFLEPDSDYVIERLRLVKHLDGGVIAVYPMRQRIESKSQHLEPPKSVAAVCILFPDGRPFLRRASSSAWIPLAGKEAVMPGDQVRCDKGSTAVMTYSSGLKVRVLSGSLLYVLPSSLEFEYGLALVDTGEARSFTVSTSMSRVVAGPRTVFRIKEGKKGCEVHSLRGKVSMLRKAQGPVGITRARAGQSVAITRAGAVLAPFTFIPKKAAEQWAGFVSDTFKNTLGSRQLVKLSSVFIERPAGKKPAGNVLTSIKSARGPSGGLQDVGAVTVNPASRAPGPSGEGADSPVAARRNKPVRIPTGVSASSSEGMTQLPPARPADIEELFQLPRLDTSVRHQARPSK